MPRPFFAAFLVVAAACHATSSTLDDITGQRVMVPHPDQARAGQPALEVTEDGRFQVVEALVCPTEVTAQKSRYEIVTSRPNFATAILGIIAASAGGVAAAVGLSADSPGDEPATWLGVAGVVGGVPFAVLPFFGNRTERTLLDERTVTLDTTTAPCGTRPIADAEVSVRTTDMEVLGRLDSGGRLDVPAFAIVDAFALQRAPELDLDVVVTRATGPIAFRAEIDAEHLARGRDGFLREAGVDARVERAMAVPDLHATQLTLGEAVEPGGRPAAKIVLLIDNRGPGDAYQVRGVLQSSDRRIEGRILYVGFLPHAGSRRVEMSVPLGPVPLAPAAHFGMVLRDADETASQIPVRGRRLLPP